MSQLLSRLQGQLSQATDPTTRAEITAKICCIHARVGHFAQAQQLITALRQEFGDGHDPRASVWIMLAEGLNCYYDQQFQQSLDRLTRSQFLALNMRYSAFIGIASAWKAFIEYHEARYDAMAASLKLALDHVVVAGDLDTQTRICLIVAIGYRFLGERDQAREWFYRGHHYAVKNGDQAAIEALLHNSAVGAVNFLRIAHAEGQTHAEVARRARFELESAKNLNSLTQAQSLLEHLHLQDARLKMIEGRFAEATDSIATAMRCLPKDGVRRTPQIATLELQYCAYRQGDTAAIGRYFETLPTVDQARLARGDRIAVAFMGRELAQAGGRFDESAALDAMLEELLAAHRADSGRLADALRQVTSQWTPDIASQAQDNVGDYY